MIVVTGPGRSGTSVVASLYKALGFDPGGPWRERDNAGYEHGEFVEANERLMAALGTSVAMGRRARRGRWGRRGRRVDAFLGSGSAGRASDPAARLVDWSRYGGFRLDVLQWQHLVQVVEEFGPRLRALSQEVEVVKDPRFCFTLPAWLEAGASVDALVLVLRDLDAVVDSRSRSFGHVVGERGRSWAKNDFVYGIGLAVSSAFEHRVPVQIFRFPDLLGDPGDLHSRLPLPQARSPEQFEAAFAALRDESLVHDSR